jgi:hypothetical protein
MPSGAPHPAPAKPLALVVFLENVGHISGLTLPAWTMAVIDFVTEEYAKLLLRLYGAYRRYDRVVILEDAQANGPDLVAALVRTSRTHRVDVLLLVHGQPCALVGYRGQISVGPSTFDPLIADYQADPDLLDLRMVYGVNCYGASLAPTWLALGAQATNGAVGVNWLPEPSISVFLYNWLAGRPFSQAVTRSHQVALRWGRRVWRPRSAGQDHPCIAGSRQAIFGVRDLTIAS